MNIQINTLDYANRLEQAGIARSHAEAIAKLRARAVNGLVEHELVTKETLRSELAQLEARLRTEIKADRSQHELRLRDDMHALQSGGAIAMFALSVPVVLTRLIR